MNENEEYELDSIRGEAGKKPKMSILNQSNITKEEMDKLMNNWEDAPTTGDDDGNDS